MRVVGGVLLLLFAASAGKADHPGPAAVYGPRVLSEARKEVCFDAVTGEPIIQGAAAGWCLDFCIDGDCSSMCDWECRCSARAEDRARARGNCRTVRGDDPLVALHPELLRDTDWARLASHYDTKPPPVETRPTTALAR